MSKKAYLIGFIDKATGMFSHAWYYGEHAGSLTHDTKRWHAFDLASEEGSSYEAAIARTYLSVCDDAYLQWLVPYIRSQEIC